MKKRATFIALFFMEKRIKKSDKNKILLIFIIKTQNLNNII